MHCLGISTSSPTHARLASAVMIILDEDAHQLPKLNPFVAGTTVRLPDPVTHPRTPTPLPDYETSQAQQEHLFRKTALGRWCDLRFWRATIWALAIYVGITLVLAISFVVVVNVVATHRLRRISLITWLWSRDSVGNHAGISFHRRCIGLMRRRAKPTTMMVYSSPPARCNVHGTMQKSTHLRLGTMENMSFPIHC
jgi:hypothetical protein